MPTDSPSPLDKLIPAEIKDNYLSGAIARIARRPDVRTILEIGSSSGDGSTAAFVRGMRENPSRPTLFCLEVSKARFAALRERYAADAFVKPYNASSVPPEAFPGEEELTRFYHAHLVGWFRPLPEVLRWLHDDLAYVRGAGVPTDGIARIKREHGIDRFDMVLIDGSEFSGSAELDEVYGARFILLDDVKTYKCLEACRRLDADPAYRLREINRGVRNGYAIFERVPADAATRLPVHFVTIVLNGMPFLRHHVEQMRRLDFDWHWHVVEGVAALAHDTAWSVAAGGSVPDAFHKDGRSTDGTTEYLDELAREFPDRVHVYRKPPGQAWDGKREMVNAPLDAIDEDAVLWEVDADELWTAEQFAAGRKLFLDDPGATAAIYWSWMFVGPDRVISTRHCYGNNPQMEWLRTWRYRPGMRWLAHEPPVLAEPLADGRWRNVHAVKTLRHDETEAAGLVFQHYAYATEGQVRFKQDYYGYRGAVDGWRALQAERNLPARLGDFFPWVADDTQVDLAAAYVAAPLIELPASFPSPGTPGEGRGGGLPPRPRVVIDGVFFQLYNTGIARVWRQLLDAWVADGFAGHLVLLDRGRAPRVPGVRVREVARFDYDRADADRRMLQRVCDEEGADVFISTYYTTPVTTPSVFMAHDMIPERFGWDLRDPMWQEKHHGVRHATAFVCVSEATRRDLLAYFPQLPPERVHVTPLAAAPCFFPRPAAEVDALRKGAGLAKPYFMTAGIRGGYKNTILTFRALGKFPELSQVDLLCAGPKTIEPVFQQLIPGKGVRAFELTDDELAAAYSGAIALLHPSSYEGFGLPVLEAMACGCPVITTRNGSLAEVGGDAALFVGDDDVEGMVAAMQKVRRPAVRERMVAAGREHAKGFSWARTAAAIRNVLEGVAAP